MRLQRRGEAEKNGRCLFLVLNIKIEKPQGNLYFKLFFSFLIFFPPFFSTALECFRDGNLYKSLPAAGRMNHHRCFVVYGTFRWLSLSLSLKLTQNETHEGLKLISEFCTLPTKTETIETKFLVKTWLAATRMGNGI